MTIHSSVRFAIFLLISIRMFASTISGTIHDHRGKPLSGTNVMIEGTSIGCMSDSLGRFRLTGLSPGIHSVRISFIGYETVVCEINVGSDESALDVQMLPKILRLSALQVIGEQRPDEIARVNVLNPDIIKDLPGSIGDIYRAVRMISGVNSL